MLLMMHSLCRQEWMLSATMFLESFRWRGRFFRLLIVFLKPSAEQCCFSLLHCFIFWLDFFLCCRQGLLHRNNIVYTCCFTHRTPLVITMGSGYSKPWQGGAMNEFVPSINQWIKWRIVVVVVVVVVKCCLLLPVHHTHHQSKSYNHICCMKWKGRNGGWVSEWVKVQLKKNVVEMMQKNKWKPLTYFYIYCMAVKLTACIEAHADVFRAAALRYGTPQRQPPATDGLIHSFVHSFMTAPQDILI